MRNNAQYLFEISRKALDIDDHAGALLTDLSKAFTCVDHDSISMV